MYGSGLECTGHLYFAKTGHYCVAVTPVIDRVAKRPHNRASLLLYFPFASQMGSFGSRSLTIRNR
jgi:hypothetical protein